MLTFEIIFLIVSLSSTAGLVILFAKKIRQLDGLPKTTPAFEKRGDLWRAVWTKVKEKLAKLPFLRNFSLEISLQKILSKTRVLTLKLENKMAGWLEILRKKSQEKNRAPGEDDHYWQELQNKKE
jgi:hypothetical protein